MMKRTFKFYSVIWAILLVLFNIISFVSVGWSGQEKYTTAFWTGYIFITFSFVGQLICAYFALRGNELKKTFYNISLITTSYFGLILSFVFGGVCMLISSLPYWVGIIICALILAFNIISVIKASAVVDIVSRVDDKIKSQTLFIKSLTAEAEELLSRAKSEKVKTECKRVYDAVRYSDPMSNEKLTSVEREITFKFSALVNAVNDDNADTAGSAAKDIVILIGKRNKKCMLLK